MPQADLVLEEVSKADGVQIPGAWRCLGPLQLLQACDDTGTAVLIEAKQFLASVGGLGAQAGNKRAIALPRAANPSLATVEDGEVAYARCWDPGCRAHLEYRLPAASGQRRGQQR